MDGAGPAPPPAAAPGPSTSGTFPTGGTTIGGTNSKKMTDVLSLDYCTFRVPYEEMNVRFRQGQKNIERASHVTAKAASLLSKKINGSKEPMSKEALRKNFDFLIKTVQDAKAALNNSMDSTIHYSALIMNRCERLEAEYDDSDEEEADPKEMDDTERRRFARYIAWHLLRCGMIEPAKELIKEMDLDGLIDVDVFEQIFEVEQGLHDKDTRLCIAWCDFNRSKLRRIGSRMEIVARQQDVVSHIEKGEIVEAIGYVKKHIVPIAKASFSSDITKLMGAIACPLEESKIRNPEYHAEDRYEQCAAMFIKEAYRLYGLNGQSAMETLIQVGLASHKTPSCKPDHETPKDKQKCIVCRPEIFPLAEDLPYAHVDNSRILCSMSGTVCDDDENIPYLFPSGHVFGLQAIERLRRPENKIWDPVRKVEMREEEALRLYFL